MRIFAVCDTEIGYAQKLAERMSTEKEVFEQVQVFDSVEAVLEYRKKTPIEMLILAEEFVDDYVHQLKDSGIANIFLLSADGTEGDVKGNYRSFFKYRAASVLIKEIMQAYRQEVARKNVFMSEGETKTTVFGVFAPVHCVEKTVWALLSGLIMAKEKHVLYLNMEKYAGFDALFEKRHTTDLSEVFYRIMHEREKDASDEVSFESYKGLSYIPPIRFSRELDGLTEETVLNCVKKIIGLSEDGKIPEKVIVLDFSGSTCGYRELFGLCDKVFLICRNDCMTEASVEAFEEEYRIMMGSCLPSKVEKVQVSALKEGLSGRFLELNVEGEFGRTIKNILQKGELFD